jgi:hypothetical protein
MLAGNEGTEESGHKFQPQIQDANERRRERERAMSIEEKMEKIRNVLKPVKERRVR